MKKRIPFFVIAGLSILFAGCDKNSDQPDSYCTPAPAPAPNAVPYGNGYRTYDNRYPVYYFKGKSYQCQQCSEVDAPEVY